MSHHWAALWLAATLSIMTLPSAHASHAYDQPVWFTWDTMELDVIVLGVNDPVIMAAIREAIDAWRVGIPQFVPSWLAEGLVLRVYIPAVDPVPPPDFEVDDVEITFVPEGYFAFNPCAVFPTPACGTTDQVCQAFAPFPIRELGLLHLFDAAFRSAAHEFGHCLGLGHVFDHGVEYKPGFDLMGNWVSPACPSNLNVLVLERVFGGLIGLPSGGAVTIAAGDYLQADC